MWRGERMKPHVFLICSPLPCRFEPGFLTEPGSGRNWLEWRSRETIPSFMNTLAPLCLATSVGVRDLNSGPQALMTSILLSELSPQSLKYLLIKVNSFFFWSAHKPLPFWGWEGESWGEASLRKPFLSCHYPTVSPSPPGWTMLVFNADLVWWDSKQTVFCSYFLKLEEKKCSPPNHLLR